MAERCRHELLAGACSTCNAERARAELLEIFKELEMETGMGVIVRQKVKGDNEPWWVFITHKTQRTSMVIGDKKAAEEVASELRVKLRTGKFKFPVTKKQKRRPKMTIDLKKDRPGDLFINETGCLNRLESFCAEPTACMESVLDGGKVGGSIHSPNLRGFKRISDIDKEDLVDIIKDIARQYNNIQGLLEIEKSEHAKTKDKLAAEMSKGL